MPPTVLKFFQDYGGFFESWMYMYKASMNYDKFYPKAKYGDRTDIKRCYPPFRLLGNRLTDQKRRFFPGYKYRSDIDHMGRVRTVIAQKQKRL